MSAPATPDQRKKEILELLEKITTELENLTTKNAQLLNRALKGEKS